MYSSFQFNCLTVVNFGLEVRSSLTVQGFESRNIVTSETLGAYIHHTKAYYSLSLFPYKIYMENFIQLCIMQIYILIRCSIIYKSTRS